MAKHDDKETLLDIFKYLLRNKFKELVILILILGLIFIVAFRMTFKINTGAFTISIDNMDEQIKTEVRR